MGREKVSVSRCCQCCYARLTVRNLGMAGMELTLLILARKSYSKVSWREHQDA